MQLNNSLHNFRESLISIWDNLKESGIEVGDDCWEKITNTLFKCIVETATDKDIGYYGFYKIKQNSINLEIETNCPILISKDNTWKEDTFKSSLVFEFKEFSHPWEFNDITSLDFVIGENLDNDVEICVHHKYVKFIKA